MTTLFWLLAALVFYIYVGYGLMIVALAALRPRRPLPPPPAGLSATILIAAHNEGPNIADKLDSVMSLDTDPYVVDVLLVSDGSSDDTVAKAEAYRDQGLRIIEIKSHVGKDMALNRAFEDLRSDVVVFSDADSIIEKQGLVTLLRHFGDASVGGVCGCIVMPKKRRGWFGDGEALYWEYDHLLRKAESDLAGAVSAQGSFYAVRRELIQPLLPAVADDLLVSLRVTAQGRRLVFEPDARVEITVTGSSKREFARRVRVTERGVRGLLLNTELLNPFRFGFFSVQLFSHKWLRRLGPFFVVLLMAINLSLIGSHIVYDAFALAQAAVLGLTLVGWLHARQGKKGLSLLYFLVLSNCAMALGVLNAIRGKKTTKWLPVR